MKGIIAAILLALWLGAIVIVTVAVGLTALRFLGSL